MGVSNRRARSLFYAADHYLFIEAADQSDPGHFCRYSSLRDRLRLAAIRVTLHTLLFRPAVNLFFVFVFLLLRRSASLRLAVGVERMQKLRPSRLRNQICQRVSLLHALTHPHPPTHTHTH